MPRWSEADDAHVLAVDAARERAGRGTWPEEVLCPDRGKITGKQARQRCARIAGRAAAPAPARQTRRTPIKQRAANVGVDRLRPTPSGVRAIIADTAAPSAAVDAAKHQLHKHQKALLQTVARAEAKRPAQECYEEVRRLVRRRREIWESENSSDVPGLHFEESAVEQVYIAIARARLNPRPSGPTEQEERGRLFWNWLSSRQNKWRALRRRRRLQRREEEMAREKLEFPRLTAEQASSTTPADMIRIWRGHSSSTGRSCRSGCHIACFSCTCVWFCHDVRCRELEFEEFDRDEKAGEPPGFAAEMRKRRNWVDRREPQVVRAELEGRKRSEMKQIKDKDPHVNAVFGTPRSRKCPALRLESARLAENFEAAAIAEHQQDNEDLLDRRRADDRWEDSPRHEAEYIAGSFIDHLHLKVKFYEAVKDQLEHRERDGYHYVALIDRH